jgi:hypothetical protein
VHALSEAEVRVRIAADVELERVREDRLVAVRGHLPERELVARAQPLAGELGVARERAALVHRGRGPAHDLLDRHRDPLRLARESLPLSGVEQRLQAARERLARGLAAGHEQQMEEQQELAVGEARRLLAGQLGVDHHREHVVAGRGTLARDQLGPIALDALVRRAHLVVRLAQIAARVLEREVDPIAQLRARLLRNAEQHADRLERQLARDVDHEVAAAAPDRVGQDPAGAPAQLGLEVADPPRREAPVHERADPVVAGRVHHVQHHARVGDVLQERAAVPPAAARHRGERDRVEQHAQRVGMPAHHPEALAVGRMRGRLVPVDRRLAPQPREHVVRKALLEQREIGEIEIHGGGLV